MGDCPDSILRRQNGQFWLLDDREKKSQIEVRKKIDDVSKPGKVQKGAKKIIEKIPAPIRNFPEKAFETASEIEFIKVALSGSVRGTKVILTQISKLTISNETVVRDYSPFGIAEFDEIPLVRSYEIESTKSEWLDRVAAFTEGGITGTLGLWGIPFDIVLFAFLAYRCVQNIGTYYGYDMSDPNELDLAAEATSWALAPTAMSEAEFSGTYTGRILLMGELTAVRASLSKSYVEMAQKGGLPLLVVQIRALGNRGAQKALEKAGKKEIENQMVKRILEALGKNIPKKYIGRIVPIIGGFVGAALNSFYMDQLLRNANLYYKKRFLLEKETKIAILTSPHLLK